MGIDNNKSTGKPSQYYCLLTVRALLEKTAMMLKNKSALMIGLLLLLKSFRTYSILQVELKIG